MPSTDLKVLIVGGGNCGLAIATGLKKADISYTVFERDNAHDFYNRARDWGMLLHWGTEHLEAILPAELQARIREPRVDSNYESTNFAVPYVNGKTGEILGNIPSPVITRLSRKKLRRFLTDGQALNIEFDKRLASLSTDKANRTVTATFEDGTSATGNLLIGADGSHSPVRTFLLGDRAALEPTDITMINFAGAKYTAEDARAARTLSPIVQLAYHPDVRGASLLAALDCNSPNPQDWKFQNYTSWWGPPYLDDLRDHQTRLAFYKDRMSQFCEPFRSAALNGVRTDVSGSIDESVAESRSGVNAESANAQVADEIILPVYPGKNWPPVLHSESDKEFRWDNHSGMVTIAGDAAHSMLPHRGQGLNNAMADARGLVDAIVSVAHGERGLEQAITSYEDEMRPRGYNEVKLSYEQAVKGRDFKVEESPMFKVGMSKQ